MLRTLTDLFHLGDDVRHAAVRLFAYAFLTSSSYMILRSLADGLFLSYIGPDALPLAMLVAVVVVTPLTLIWTRLGGRAVIVRVILVTRLVLAAGTAALAWLLPSFEGSFPILLLLYLVAELRACLNTIQFTTLLNETLSHAHRHTAAFISAGAPLAGIVTGTVIGLELGVLSYAQLLWVAVVLDVLATLPLLSRSVNHASAERLAGESQTGADGDTDGTRAGLVRAMIVMIAMHVAVVTIVAYEWKVAAATYYGDYNQQLSRYFAAFYALCDTVTLLVQMLAAGRLFRRFGVAVGLTVLPVALGTCLAGALLTAMPIAWLIWMTCAKATDVLRRGLYDPSLTTLYRPISAVRRRRVIGMVNGFLKPLVEAGVVISIFTIDYVFDRTTPIFLVAVLLVPLWSAAGWRTLLAYRTFTPRVVASR